MVAGKEAGACRSRSERAAPECRLRTRASCLVRSEIMGAFWTAEWPARSDLANTTSPKLLRLI